MLLLRDDRLLAACLAAPLLLLALPLGTLVGGGWTSGWLADLVSPEIAATALTVVWLLPAAILLGLRALAARHADDRAAHGARAAPDARPAPSARLVRTLFLAWIGWTVVAGLRDGLPDTYAATRATLHLAVAFLAFTAGAALDARGRGVLETALVAATALLMLGALGLFGAFGYQHAGALQNSGVSSSAALPGALCAACWLAGREPGTHPLGGSRRALGAGVLVAYGLFTGAAPVLTGVLATFGALAAGALFARGARGRVALCAVVFAAAVGVGFAALGPRAAETAPAEPAIARDSGTHADAGADAGANRPGVRAAERPVTGGGEVRLRIWRATLALVRAHPLTGVGLGQFAAAFPPWRDPIELELSSYGRALEQETEVQHAHSDPLAAAAETGVLGGLLFAAFLAAACVAALLHARPVRAQPVRAQPVRAQLGGHEHPGAAKAPPPPAYAAGWSEGAPPSGLALGLVALAAAALLRTPWTSDVASALVGFALAGSASSAPARAALAAARPRAARGLERGMAAAAALALVASAPSALATLRAERELGLSFARALRRSPRAIESAERALAERPDATLALAHRARLAEAWREPPAAVRARWDAVLARRPHAVEALMQRALWALAPAAEAASGAGDDVDRDTARTLWQRALALDPTHPKILRNLVRLAAEEGRAEDVASLLERLALTEGDALDPAWLSELGDEAAFGGHASLARELWGRVDPALRELAPDPAWSLHQRAEAANEPRHADALQTYAHLGWGRAQAEHQSWSAAARSYRQASATAWRGRGRPAPRIELELAAVLWRAGRPDEARSALTRANALARDLSLLPDWAGQALLDGRLLPD